MTCVCRDLDAALGASMGLLGKPLGGDTRVPRNLTIATAVPCLRKSLKCLFLLGKFTFARCWASALVNV